MVGGLLRRRGGNNRGPRRSPTTAQPLAAMLPYGCGVSLAGKWVRWGEEEQRSE